MTQHPPLQAHSVGEIYPYAIVGVGDFWEVHNLETGERLESRSLPGLPFRATGPRMALTILERRRENGRLRWLPAVARPARVRHQEALSAAERYAGKIKNFAFQYGPPRPGSSAADRRARATISQPDGLGLPKDAFYVSYASPVQKLREAFLAGEEAQRRWPSRAKYPTEVLMGVVAVNEEPLFAGVPMLAFMYP